nr:MAG TPA: hypothetical protein [Caudoviricetes sp.]
MTCFPRLRHRGTFTPCKDQPEYQTAAVITTSSQFPIFPIKITQSHPNHFTI